VLIFASGAMRRPRSGKIIMKKVKKIAEPGGAPFSLDGAR
jgi:hypothetical protein